MYSGKLRLENGEEFDVTADGVLYDNGRLDQKLDAMKEDIESIDGKADTNAGNITSLSSRVTEVESDISALESTTAGHTTAISGLNTTVGQHTTDISNTNQSLTNHTGSNINTQDGVHGIRYYNDTLAYKDQNNTWQNIETGGGGGTSDYPDLTNKPSINGVELLGNKVIGLLSTNIQVDSDKIGYNNLTSGLSATNVKSALDELANNDIDSYPDLSNLPSINGTQLLGDKVIGLLSTNIQVDSDKIGYDNTISGLLANNVKSAIDTLKNSIPDNASDLSYDNTTSGATATNVQSVIDEVISNVYTKAQIDGKVTISSTDIGEGAVLATGNLYIVNQ